MDRREAIRWMLAASGGILAYARLEGKTESATEPAAESPGAPGDSSRLHPEASGAAAEDSLDRPGGWSAHVPVPGGYGLDPVLNQTYRAGELWPLTFSEGERAIAKTLCEIIVPQDEVSAGAGQLGVQDFIDEWISAPYAAQRADRPLILGGIRWIDAEANRRFAMGFTSLAVSQQHAILDDICYEKTARGNFKQAARFFRRYRDLTAGGFYTRPEGMKDLGYIGNVPMASFEGPPPELRRKLGLDQE